MTPDQSRLSHPRYRPDIDGLRATAVLLVVAFHAFPGSIKGGFIGVDVFFVISGFLISSIILENLETGTFSFAEFYARRVRRIFPSLIIVLAACYAFGAFALLDDERMALGKHIAAGAGFASNLVLWHESGYFDASAELKPLLHLWSLGIEEQFYIVWPLSLWLAWRWKLNLLAVIIVSAMASYLLNVRGIGRDAVATFYSPQTRFWELLSGSLLAWSALHMRAIRGTVWTNLVSVLGAILLAYGALRFNRDLKFPGNLALIPVLGTVLIISAGANAWINRAVLSNKLVVWFGLISFPLYLWHWPLLAFSRILEGEFPGKSIRAGAVMLSLALAWVTCRFVEMPARAGGHGGRKVAILASSLALVGCAGYGTLLFRPAPDPEQVRVEASILQSRKNCAQYFPDWSAVTDTGCFFQKASNNTIAIVGDSHAGHLYVGLSEALPPANSVAVFPASCAAPYLGVASALKDASARRIREGAYKLIARAYEYIVRESAITTVLLAHNPYCSYEDAVDMLNPDNKDYRKVLTDGMRRTFSALIQANKAVMVVLDNPPLPFDLGMCVHRPFRITARADRCSFPREQFDDTTAYSSYRALLESVLRDYPQIRMVDLSVPLCDARDCYISRGGHVLYGDRSHLNWHGSRYVAPYLLDAIN